MSIACTYRGLGYGFELPPGYRECEYIESTGTQWIETEVPAQINVKLQGKIQFPDWYYDDYFASLRVHGGDARYYLLNINRGSSKGNGFACTKYIWTYVSTNVSNEGVSVPVEFESYIGDTSCYIKVDSRMYENNNVRAGVPTNKTIPLFGGKLDNSDVVNAFSPRTRLWYARLLVNDVLVRDFIPCLDYDGIPCMYDTISGKTFYNQGTGTFNYKLK